MAGRIGGAEPAGNVKKPGLQEEVQVHAMPFGAQILPRGQGVRFRLWAPSAQSVELILEHHPPIPMPIAKDGWASVDVAHAGPNTCYQYRLNGELSVPDPASRYQPQDVHGPSQVIDPTQFHWKDTAWRGRPWNEVILYELHVGTFSPEGTFQGVKNRLDALVELGITAIEIMPLSDFPGTRNWGYDGVLPFAPDSSYGTPDDLKDLIQTAHAKGLMVFLDVVYNHFGPEGNYLYAYAKPFLTEQYHTPWGNAIQFDKAIDPQAAQNVRNFFIHNALYWLIEYRFDGLRLDAVHTIFDHSSPHFLEELAQTVRQTLGVKRQVHLVLENDKNEAHFLKGKNAFKAQWNDDFHHAMHVLLTGETGGYYADYHEVGSKQNPAAHAARCLAEGFAYQGEVSSFRQQNLRGETSSHLPTTAFVNFLQNHDQIGNRAFGERLAKLAPKEAIRAALGILLLAPSIPLLFMGEEWGADSPFLFFCDFCEELSQKVTAGRRAEFARFPQFSDPASRERIADPAAISTYERSHLDWQACQNLEHSQWRAFYQELIAIRKREIIPRLGQLVANRNEHADQSRRYAILGQTGFLVGWQFLNGTELTVIANLGAQILSFKHLEFYKNQEKIQRTTIWQSSPQVLKSSELPPWSVYWGILSQKT